MLLLAFPAAYALSIKPVKKWTDVLFFFLSTKMLPVVAGLLPIYLFAQNVGLLDNIWLLIILYTSMNLPIAVWMLRSFLAEVPVEMLEAASVDGAGLIRTLRSVDRPGGHAGHRRRRADLLHLQLERAAVRPGAHRHRGADRPGVPDRLRHQPGPVPGQGLCARRLRGVAAGARSPGSPPRTSWSRACRWARSSDASRHCTIASDPGHARRPGLAEVRRPAYDRSQVTAGIVHFGVGGFHRAHQAMYLDRLMNEGKALDWGIVRRRRAAAATAGCATPCDGQDGLYTLVVKHPDGRR